MARPGRSGAPDRLGRRAGPSAGGGGVARRRARLVLPERREPQHDERDADDDQDPAGDHRGAAPNTSPSVPCRTSASRGPPRDDQEVTPCIRPRISSVARRCRIAPRKTMLTRSAAPATARKHAATHSERESPKAGDGEPPRARPRPRSRRPCRRTRVNAPDSSPASRAPTGIAANSTPRASPPPGGSPKVRSAISREQRPRHAEHHGDDVGEERHQQHLRVAM